MQTSRTSYASSASATQALFSRIYAWMTAGLLVTAAVAFASYTTGALLTLMSYGRFALIGVIIVELGVVWYLSARINSLSVSAAAGLFLAYAALNGLTISVVLFAFTLGSTASVFLITALMFAGTSVYGFTTGRDMSSWGSILFMGLFGLIIASVVNLFLRSEMLGWIVSFVGVLLFTALTAYDTQKLKALSETVEGEVETGRLAILGALTLYLDFINLFLFLVRILGRRR